ncbi:Zn-ribbon domain-containing OB-fold protein [Castellaniella sp. MT123]|uniref:Zn-ribbon domain-containing OB-fold protein n=1 Tax=Castellaniella sp. MT123 TaxID=3140381 RepID=UPI0031F3DCD1
MSDKIELPANPLPSQVGADLYYRTQLDQGHFLIQRCAACSRNVFFPRMICPHCGSDRLDWFSPSGEGVVYSTTVVHRKAEQGGDYNVALIDLKEGVRMMSRVEGLAPADVKIGMAVKARVVDADGSKLVVFNLSGGRS